MTYFFIIVPVILICIILIYVGSRVTPPIKEEEEPKFEPKKVTNPSQETIGVDPYQVEKPKRRYRKKRKKKPTVANNAQVEKRPVGRPRKVE
jgi:hypothetical protein